MVSLSKSMVSHSKSMVSFSKSIVCLSKLMISLSKSMVSLGKSMISLSKSMVSLGKSMVSLGTSGFRTDVLQRRVAGKPIVSQNASKPKGGLCSAGGGVVQGLCRGCADDFAPRADIRGIPGPEKILRPIGKYGRGDSHQNR